MGTAGSNRLAGRVTIVTGAGSQGDGTGNGKATAILCAREGARLVLVDSERQRAEQTRAAIAAETGADDGCVVVEADVSDQVACEEIVSRATAEFGRVDVLVNNVGIAGPSGTAVEVDPAEWDDGMRVNVKSMMLMAKFCIPEFRKTGHGAIVNLASVAGLAGGHPGLLYPTSKGAVINLTRAMAAHHGTEGIRVNAVAPGMVYTPMVAGGGMSAEERDARRRRSLLQTEGTAWDVASAVVFLASEEARWITGAILPVDAGATAGQSRLPVPDPRPMLPENDS